MGLKDMNQVEMGFVSKTARRSRRGALAAKWSGERDGVTGRAVLCE